MTIRGRRWVRSPALTGVAVALLLTSCVDHGQNTAQFCDALASVLDPARDRELLSEELATERADAVADEMRHAEDGRRPVREAARDLIEGYDELVELLGDEDATTAEITETVEELETARVDTRAACAASTAEDGEGEG